MPHPTHNEYADGEVLASVFEERAENLSKPELQRWSAKTDSDRIILAKLKGPGAKLLSGPRGSGKSTLLRKAYFDLLDDQYILTAYVNYAKSLALEPLFHSQANALQLFRQWVLLKIIDGLNTAFISANRPKPNDLAELAAMGSDFIHDLEIGSVPDDLPRPLSPTQLLLLLERWCDELGLRRCVLLLDDAAHAFSPEQQHEFFEIFRNLRSRVVSAKAAVYPGITMYSPHFHVGHEAELIEAWYQPEDQGYLATMRSVAQRRLPHAMFDRFSGREELLDYLALASFGLPRGFLTMLSQLLGVEEVKSASRPTRPAADAAIAAYANSVKGIFLALGGKIPRYKHFIRVGSDVERAIALQIRSFNQSKSVDQKAVVIAVAEPIAGELRRIMAFLEYAGVVRKLDTVSRGVKGVFQRYALHYAIVLKENALHLGQSYATDAAVQALLVRNAHAYVRTSGSSLLGPNFLARCKLDLAPCQKCGTPRGSEDARFCTKCGSQLSDASIYAELLKTSIRRLPLTQRKINDLLRETRIQTVQDILLDEDAQQIRTVPYIGPIWAARIRNAAEEFVSV